MLVPHWYKTLVVALLVPLVCTLFPPAVSARSLTPEDLTSIRIAKGAIISHDGRIVAFTVMRLDAAKNTYKDDIWLVPAVGGPARQLTRGDADSDPQWTPDDRTIVFVSGRAGKSQI